MPVKLRIIEGDGGAIASTSANISGQAPGLDTATVNAQPGFLGGLILDGGRVPGGIASTIIEIGPAGPVVLRQGGIPDSELIRHWRAVAASPA